MNGGRIFIDTGAIIQCQNSEEVAGILAHELGHIVARHTVERSTGHFLAEYVARIFGFQGPLGIDLVTSRVSIIMLDSERVRWTLVITSQRSKHYSSHT